MTHDDMVDEMVARGAEDNATRNSRWINLAYQEIVNGHDWPFTEAFITGSANTGIVEIDDLRKVLYVGDLSGNPSTTPGRRLRKASFDVLARGGVEDINETGTAEFWWLQRSPVAVVAFPAAGTIFVQYHLRTPDLATTDVPIFDAAYHYLIVDRAMVEVAKDNDQDDEAVNKMRLFERGLAKMVEEYGVDTVEHDYIDILDPYDG